MKVAGIQMKLLTGELEQNKEKGKKLILEAIRKGAQLVVLPELWSSGYHLNKSTFAKLQLKSQDIVDEFCLLAREYGVVLVVPFIDKKEDQLYIAAAVIETNGDIVHVYHKTFLWDQEQQKFAYGKRDYVPVQTSVGKIGIVICYDIEFPETSRILALRGAELIIVPSYWSLQSEKRWDIQLPARAVDNTVFILAVNSVNEKSFGKSKLINPQGAMLFQCSRLKEEILLCDIDLNQIQVARAKIPYLQDFDYSLVPGLVPVDFSRE
ncbi:nitrilase-related carbon-nitrogen hydrolase [Ureibacillus sp. NPDC094379]